jgi:hypothetical protein
MTPRGRDCLRAVTALARPTPSPPHAGKDGSGSPSGSRSCWEPAINTDATTRDGAWVAEATGLVDLSSWPEGSRLILRKERPHPGAQLRFTDVDGHRITGFLTDTTARVVPGQLAGLELRHRQHARVEDRIREAKATGLRNMPCHAFALNTAWLHLVLTAIDLTCWAKLLAFKNNPALRRAEIDTLRYRILHTAARITHTSRRAHLRLDQTWPWTPDLTQAWQNLRAAFP